MESKRRAVLLAFAWLAGMYGLFGCMDLSRFSHNYGRVDLIKPGMSVTEVINKIGQPKKVIRGEGLQINWREMVYPKGSVFLYRLQVQKVLERSELTSVPDEDDPMMAAPYRSENIFEEDAPGHSPRESESPPRR